MPHTNDVQLVPNGGWDERILVCRNAPLVDTTIVISERYVVIVDTMINDATAERLRWLAQSHLDGSRSLLVVNTHADYDHCWGNQFFAVRGVPIIGNRLSESIFTEADSVAFLEQMRSDEPGIFGGVVPTPPTILFDETLTIDGGDLTLALFATPGHTVDHTSIYIPEIRTLLAADAAEIPYPIARTAAGLPPMRASLAQLAALETETVLYCHAPTEIGAQLLHDNMAYFDRLEAACRTALERGIPAEPPADGDVIELVGLPYALAVPDGDLWQHVHEYYRTMGHAQQLRQMLAAVGGS